jgi:hypothetical protein
MYLCKNSDKYEPGEQISKKGIFSIKNSVIIKTTLVIE